ncbi:MAG: hypothetical protein SVS85_03875 [Candidatus Nanohaloarchaea archaeon]|nr:hypothetical protein [Candidatus Nanohaloarchaea archaeon]
METAFYRPGKDKCPNCGSFGVEEEDHKKCPTCETRFNRYVVLEEGKQASFKNN